MIQLFNQGVEGVAAALHIRLSRANNSGIMVFRCDRFLVASIAQYLSITCC